VDKRLIERWREEDQRITSEMVRLFGKVQNRAPRLEIVFWILVIALGIGLYFITS